MPISTPNIDKDLIGIKGAIEITEHVLQNGGKLHPRFHMEVHRDVLERYLAARAGVVFDPEKLDHLFENSVARRRGEFAMVRIPYEDIHDIFRVLSRIKETGDLIGADQLPPTPLKQLSPVSAVNNIVNGWTADLKVVNHPDADVAMREKLEAIANLILHEANPHHTDLTSPRRRITDFQISAPLLVHNLDRIRDTPAQQEFAEVCDASDLDFAIVKSAVGAYITLVSQHGLAPDVSGMAEMYRRGLLPLSILTKNNGVIDNICLLIGRDREELIAAVAKVEETHSAQRPALVDQLLEQYEAHLENVAKERHDRLERESQQKNRPVANTQDSKKSDLASKRKTTRESELDVETEALVILRTSAALAEDSSWLANALFTQVLTHPEAPLPEMTGFTRAVDSLDERFQVNLQPTDVWFSASYLQGFHNNVKIAQAAGSKQFLPIIGSPTSSITCYLLAAREVDIFVEGMLAHSAVRTLLVGKDRGPEFKKAVKALGSIVTDLDRLHLNTLESLRDILQLKANLADTGRAWRKLLHNPLMQRTPDAGQTVINLDDDQIREASLLYHLPLSLTRTVFANEFVGMAWDLTDEQFAARIDERNEFDTTGRVQEVGESMRHSLSTAGIETVVRGYPLKLSIQHPEGFREFVRPVSSRYDDIFESDGDTYDMIFNALPPKPGAQPIAGIVPDKATPDAPTRIYQPPGK